MYKFTKKKKTKENPKLRKQNKIKMMKRKTPKN